MDNSLITVPPEFLARKRLVICGLLIDRSGSMRKFPADAPRQAVNEHLSSLKTNENAADTLVFVATFADGVRFDIVPQPLSEVSELKPYAADGRSTLLYGSILMLLKGILELKAQAEAQGVEVILKFDVLTDGHDEPSEEYEDVDFKTPLQRLTAHALESGAELTLWGIGLPCQAIASDIGFPPESAIQVPATVEGIKQTIRDVTARTHITMIYGTGTPSSTSSR